MKSNKISEKVFKIKKIELTQGKEVTVIKRRLFKKNATKKNNIGAYKIQVMINGKSYCKDNFEIIG